MQQKVYVDTSVLILLSKINQLNLLQLIFTKVYITKEVLIEYSDEIPNWIIVENTLIENIEPFDLDKGEASLINIAISNNNIFLVIDDAKARRIAKILNLNFIGTIGVIITAKNLHHIKKIKPLLNKIKNTNFRLSKEIYTTALQLAGEL